jgi:beta-lactamase class A
MRLVLLLLLVSPLVGQSLEKDLTELVSHANGRIGICAGNVCLHGDERFSLQSVVKLMVAVAAMDRLDMNEKVTIYKKDLSLYQQPIADLVTDAGYTTTLDDLARRAIVDSDSAAVDILFAKLGGPAQVQAFLNRKDITGMRIDRDERHLQTEICGLTWRPEFVDRKTLDDAIAAVPKANRDKAYAAYQKDVRDTATPKGMALFLRQLADGRLLSPKLTEHVIDIMIHTATGPDRLKAGVPAGWKLAHKTGTSGGWNGVTAATNDVGILISPAGHHIPVVVFVADSTATDAQRAALMASVAAITTRYLN